MPTYAYACKDCDHAFDARQSFSDDSLTVCPECTGSLRKKFNSVGVVFKGPGFYRTDSRDTKSSVEPGSTKTKEKPASQDGAAKPAASGSASSGSGSSGSGSSGSASSTAAPAAAAAS